MAGEVKVFVVSWVHVDWLNTDDRAIFHEVFKDADKARDAIREHYNEELQAAMTDGEDDSPPFPPLQWNDDNMEAIAGGEAYGWQFNWEIGEHTLV